VHPLSGDDAPELLVAIGDLHGHVRALDRILAALHARHAILGPRRGLRAGVTLVTAGDHVDRGRHALEVIARLRQLSRGAGRVVSLLGNHELLALQALDRAAALAARRGAGDPLADYERTTLHGANGGGAFVREFGSSPRAALREYVAQMAPNGRVGRWIRRLQPAHRARVAGRRVLFTHGDVPEPLRDAARLEAYLARVRRRLWAAAPDAGGGGRWAHPDLTAHDSIFWDRSFASLAADPQGAPAAVCRALGVDFVVTGHTPHRRITALGGCVFRIDAGMTPAYGEHEPQALVFSAAGAHALHADGTERLLASFGEALAPAA
jgi:hypothetical protein